MWQETPSLPHGEQVGWYFEVPKAGKIERDPMEEGMPSVGQRPPHKLDMCLALGHAGELGLSETVAQTGICVLSPRRPSSVLGEQVGWNMSVTDRCICQSEGS